MFTLILTFILSLFSGTDAGMVTDPADYCSPVVWGDAGSDYDQEGEWQALMDMGWKGRASDGMEALYPPDCLDV